MEPTGDNIADDVKNKYLTENFSGGMRQNVLPTQLGPDEYALLINGRCRYGTIKPVKLPRNLSNELPSGFYQGIYGVDSILIIFKDGKLWARDYSQPINVFAVDNDFQMDALQPYIYAQAVPASWFNVERKAENADTQETPILLQDPIAGTPQALVCQDTVSRPRLVFSVGSSRVAKDINEWVNDETNLTEDTREYVPIGKQMIYHDSILYMFSPDGKELYRSVTGRPLDFVIAVDTKGNKLTPLTSGKPEASRMSYAVDYNPATSLKSIPTPQPGDPNLGPGFFVGTLKSSWIVYPDYGQQLFAEPTFLKIPLFPTGPMNNFCDTDILGDRAFIYSRGITSFNSVQTLSNEGRNLPFYDDIYKLFENIEQGTTASYTTDDYAFFAVNTVYGAGVLVYDNLRKKHVSFDIYPEVVGDIKMFTEIKVGGQHRVFFITDSQVFELFTGTTATAELYTREITPDDKEAEIFPRRIRITLRNVEENGTLTMTPFVSGKRGEIQSQEVVANITPPTSPMPRPFGTGAAKNTVNKTFLIERPDRGECIGLFITMNFIADLVSVETITEQEYLAISEESGGKVFAEYKPRL